MADKFRSPKMRIASSKEDIIVLKNNIIAYFDARPYKAIEETSADLSFVELKIKFTEHFPDKIGLLASRIIDDLRSALDQACYIVAQAQKGGDPKKTHFPFGSTADEVERAVKNGNSKDIPPQISKHLIVYRPYKGGNDLLWGMNRIRNRNQHKEILFPGVSVGRMVATNFIATNIKAGFSLSIPTWDRDKNELVIIKVRAGEDVSFQDYKIFPFVNFGDVEVFSDMEVLETLNACVSITEDIIGAVEKESIALGLI